MNQWVPRSMRRRPRATQPHEHPQPGPLDSRGNCPGCAAYQQGEAIGMAMAQPEQVKETVTDRILAIIGSLPTNPDGAVYFRPTDIDHAAGVSKASIGRMTAVVINARDGKDWEVLRHGRRLVGVRSKRFAPKGSQTDRIRHALVAYSDERGKVPLDPQRLQSLVGARDLHDTTKALWDLKERGFLTLKEDKDGTRTNVRDIRLTRFGRESRLPVFQTPEQTDEVPAIVADPVEYRRSRAIDSVRAARSADASTATGPAPLIRDLPIERIGSPEPIEAIDTTPPPTDEVVAEVEPSDAPAEPVAEDTEPADPWAERFPLITEAMSKLPQQKAVAAAAAALSEAGPEFEDEAIALMERADAFLTPFEAEVVRFVNEVVLDTTRKETTHG